MPIEFTCPAPTFSASFNAPMPAVSREVLQRMGRDPPTPKMLPLVPTTDERPIGFDVENLGLGASEGASSAGWFVLRDLGNSFSNWTRGERSLYPVAFSALLMNN